ncbi:hypothetical protein BU16DRAFT_277491 [Lophium mytilinum]|uniref:Uncharacterized protein n=1 Tax=Lophium mytilinum TaxID=390894 RepID=A0A6A6R7Z5_9PEZI|nr:hypothetical protein BU16DRAFT_277491 [Lophium mytilinum]
MPFSHGICKHRGFVPLPEEASYGRLMLGDYRLRSTLSSVHHILAAMSLSRLFWRQWPLHTESAPESEADLAASASLGYVDASKMHARQSENSRSIRVTLHFLSHSFPFGSLGYMTLPRMITMFSRPALQLLAQANHCKLIPIFYIARGSDHLVDLTRHEALHYAGSSRKTLQSPASS